MTTSSGALGCRGGDYDVPLILKDAMFAADGSLIFDDRNAFGPVRRRHPRERQAVARRCGSSGASTASACSTRVSRVPTACVVDGRAVHDDRRATAGWRPFRSRSPISASGWRSATRWSSTSQSTPSASAWCCRTSPENNIDFANTDEVMAFDVVAEASTLTATRSPTILNPDSRPWR